jgi:hypothetical protein
VWRDVARATDERTSISSVIPKVLATRSNPAVGFSNHGDGYLLYGTLNSFAFDYLARQQVGGIHFNWQLLSQLPVLRPRDLSSAMCDFIRSRVLELTYTAWDLVPFAQDFRWNGPPFCWDEERRFLLRCELDAAFFQLYGVNRDDAAYILDTFPIVQRKDEEKCKTCAVHAKTSSLLSCRLSENRPNIQIEHVAKCS